MIDSNKQSKRWERNLRKYVYRANPLIGVFASIEAQRWVLFVRNIDARGWELHLRDPESGGNQSKYLSHGRSFFEVCEAGELYFVKRLWWRERRWIWR